MNNPVIFIYVLPISIVMIGLYLSFWTNIIRDKSTVEKKPYSLARAQLMWWTLIIASCYCAYYGICNELQALPPSCLILLGISVGTTASAAIIDNTDVTNNLLRHQDQSQRVNFFTDILTDENGISVHRFQAVVFNIIFGLIFISAFIRDLTYTTFGNYELALMGISSATYVAIKINENKAPLPQKSNVAKDKKENKL